MNNVKETDCTYCVHREVCGIKNEYLDLISRLPEQSNNSRFTVKVSCRYHKNEPTIRNEPSILNYVSLTADTALR